MTSPRLARCSNRPAPRRSASRRIAAPLSAALVVVLGLMPMVASAAPDWRSEALEPNSLVRPPGISVERCANIVRRETGGRVLSATPVERGGRRGCEVRVLVDGKRVRSLFVDSQGRIRD